MTHLPKTSYLCVSGWGDEIDGIEVTELDAGDGIASVDSPESICTSTLTDYATINVSGGDTEVVEFSTSVTMKPSENELSGLSTIALLGIRVTPRDVDGVLRGSLTIGSRTWHSAAPIYGQTLRRVLPDGMEGHSLLGSGLTNLIFHDLPDLATGGAVMEFTLKSDGGPDLGSTQIMIGSVFGGLQIPFANAPSSYVWSDEVANQEFITRALGHISSDGVMRPSTTFEFASTDIVDITGIGEDYYGTGGGVPMPCLMRAMIASVGQPMLLSPYPYSFEGEWDDTPDAAEVTQRLMSVRQNFFSIYGLLDRRTEIGLREYNNGLESEYRARLRFMGIR